MRLVCPNCSAQYEIDGSMIPDEGRDVQCSNCGHTWFELPPPSADFSEIGPEDFAASDSTAEFEDTSSDDTSREAVDDTVETHEAPETDAAAQASDEDTLEALEPEVAVEPHSEDEPETDTSPSGAVAAAAAAAVAEEVSDPVSSDATTLKPRRPADAADLDILRQEAERELSQRRAPPSESIETQTDMGLDEIKRRDTPSRALRARMAHLGEDEPEAKSDDKPVSQPRPPSEPEHFEEPRRDLLPDIDEINSTLKPAANEPAEGRGGFITGFFLMILITIALIVAYAQAPAIARAFPGSESALISYVDRANGVRDWVGALFE